MRIILLCLAALVLSGCNPGKKLVTTEREGFKMPEDPVIIMETNQGMIKLKLFPEIAPLACENMIRLSEKGYYDGLVKAIRGRL